MLLAAATDRLAGAGISTPRADAEWLLAGLTGQGRARLALGLDRAVDPELALRYAAALGRRQQREPLQRILGWEDFRGLRFALGPDVLVPRPETEVLVELALGLLPPPGPRPPMVVDVGTGSGCIACSMAHERRDLRVVAIERALAALALARTNVTALGLTDRVRLVAGDTLSTLDTQSVDLVVANLPYLPTAVLASLMPEVRDHEPRLALDGGPDGLDQLRPLIADMPRVLRPGGALVLETAGNPQLRDVATLLASSGFTGVTTRADLTGTDRFVLAHRLPGTRVAVPSAGSAGAIRTGGRQGGARRKARDDRRKGGEAPLRV
jgi:release factor glutamine methyltransferase